MIFFNIAFAQAAEEEIRPEETVQVDKTASIEETMRIEEASAWEFGLGLGSGSRDNIIVNSEEIELNAFVHIAYFGEKFFFDNGDIGYFITNNDSWNINLIAGINSERQFFENLNNFGVDLSYAADNSDSIEVPVTEDTPILKPTDRDTTFDGGFELLGDGSWGSFQLQINTDISNKHNGYELWSGYSYDFEIGSFKIRPSLGLIYKSDKWTNYFYGVRENEVIKRPHSDSYIRAPYSASNALNSFYKLSINYPLTDRLRIVGIFENVFLDKTIWSSPIVHKDKMTTQFLGLFYEF